MLSIAKLGQFAEEYYLATVAEGAEDYYVGRGEAPGYWMGHGSQLLDLDGVVHGDDLRAVLGGHAPDGRQLAAGNRTLAGFDLTFSVPKSVSVLAALRPDLDAQITEICEIAMSDTLEWLEVNACGSRRGHNGIVQVPGNGFVAATFRHRTSRDADPQLHWHVVIANTTRGPDGKWRTLDGAQLYPMAKTAGYLFEAHLRDGLTRVLGVQWDEPVNGIAEIGDFPRSLLELFSKRSIEIEEAMEANGWTSAKAAQIAAYATRKAKGPAADPIELTRRWQAEAQQVGWDSRNLNRVLGRAGREQLREQLGELLIGPQGVTEQRTTFTRADALRFIANASRDGITIQDAEALADETMARSDVVRLGADAANQHETIRRPDGRLVRSGRNVERYSTVELMRCEAQLVELCTQPSLIRRPCLRDADAAAEVDAHRRLSDEQARLVASLLTSDRFCDVVIAPAGSGKTFSLRAAGDAWTRHGYHVLGACLAGRAAKELHDQAGIPSDTLAMLNIRLDAGQIRLDARTILVIDESAMSGTRQLRPLLERAHAGGSKVVLVGDPHQLQSIEAGGLLQGLADRVGVLELVENRRQRATWEREALKELRNGDATAFLDAYRQHGRITTAPTEIDLRHALVTDWRRHTAEGHCDVRIIALHRVDIAYFNRAIRAVRRQRGELTGPTVTTGRLELQVGDDIVTLRNDRRLGLVNGERGTIVDLDADARHLHVRTANGERRLIPAGYLDDGHVDHAYAITIHKAQGLTADVALVYGSEDLYREALYTALSRARHHTQLYVTGQPPQRQIEQPHAPQPAMTEDDLVTRWLDAARTETLAIDTPGWAAGHDLGL